MSDDAGRGHRGGVPAHGSAGPLDPTADPVTDPGMRIPATPDQNTGPVALPSGPSAPPATTTSAVRSSKTGGLWVGLILSALVLLLLLVFILQHGIPYRSPSSPSRAYSPSGWRCCWRRSPGSCSWRFRAA